MSDLIDLPIEPIQQSTMTELVAKRLVRLLSEGRLKAGDKIPTERDLAKQLNVGRTTLREALKLLTLSGLLEARRGDGTYVRTEFKSLLSQELSWPLLLNTSDLDMISDVRLPLEVQAARLAAERATDEDVQKLAVFRQLLTIHGRDYEKETALDLEFHDAIAEASHNVLLCHLMRSLHSILRQYILLSNEMTESLDAIVADHQPIYDAIVSRNPEAAESAVKRHLASSRKWIVRAFGPEAPNVDSSISQVHA